MIRWVQQYLLPVIATLAVAIAGSTAPCEALHKGHAPAAKRAERPAAATPTNETKMPRPDAVAYTVLDAETGQTLWSKNGDLLRHPASITKLMTAWCTLDAIQQGKISWNDPVTISSHVGRIRQSGVGLRAGEVYPLQELFYAMFMRSANDCAVAIAEHVAGTEAQFVERMNQKCEEQGLTHTRFVNACGLEKESYPDHPDWGPMAQITTAVDLSHLAAGLLRDHPEILHFSAHPPRLFFPHTRLASMGKSTDLMLPGQPFHLDGMDGLKTGYTDPAGYCFVGSAKRGSQRIVTVVLGAATENERFRATRELMEYTFANYERRLLLRKGDFSSHISVAPRLLNGVKTTYPVGLADDLWVMVPRGEADNLMLQPQFTVSRAPLTAGQQVGLLQAVRRNRPDPVNSTEEQPATEVLRSVPLVAETKVAASPAERVFLRDVYFIVLNTWQKYL